MPRKHPKIKVIENRAIGQFVYGEHAKMFSGYPDENYYAASLHESMHASLAQSTSLGLCMSAIGSLGPKVPRKVQKLLDWLVAETRLIQEGLATYAQWVFTSIHLSRDDYASELMKRGTEYANAFSLASRVDEIIEEESTCGWNPEDRHFVRHCLLLDICRFAMNPRLPHSWFEAQGEKLRFGMPFIGQARFRRILGNVTPDQRFRIVLEELATKPELRRRLLSKGLPMVERWREGYKSPRFQEGRYIGISIHDTLEPVIAELFPKLLHETLLDEAIRVGATPPSFESAESFLRRTYSVEFAGEPTIDLASIAPPVATTFDRLLAMVNDSDNLGCYLKFVVNLSDTTQIQYWNKSKLPIAPQRALTICFGARLSPNNSGLNEWNFEIPPLCGIVNLPTIDDLLDCARNDNIIACLEIRGSLDTANRLLTDLSRRHRRSIFAHAVGRGITPLIDLLNTYIEAGGVDVYWTRNEFESFQGGGSTSLWVAFVVPRLPLRNLCWVYITTGEVAYSLSEVVASKHIQVPSDIAIHGGLTQGVPIGFYIHNESHPAFTDGPLWRTSDDQRYDALGPWGGEIVLAQLTKMGF